MGSCLSSDKKSDDKEELTCQVNRQTKIELAQLKKISQMNFEEKYQFIQSIELTEFCLCGNEKNSSLKEVIESIFPEDNNQFINYLKQIVDKIKYQHDNISPSSNPNHSQYTNIVNHYFQKLEKPLSKYIQSKNHQKCSLIECFYVVGKTLHVLMPLQDPDLKDEERWWETGKNHSPLLSEIDNCLGYLDGSASKGSNDYLQEIYGNLNKQDILSQVLRNYFPILYKYTIEFVIFKH